MSDNPWSIEARLETELESARIDWDQARSTLQTLAGDGAYNQVNAELFRNAKVKERAAAAIYIGTLKRFTEFVLKGQYPSDGWQPKKKAG